MVELTFEPTDEKVAILELGDRAASLMLSGLGNGFYFLYTEDKTEEVTGWPTWTVYGVGSNLAAGEFCFCPDEAIFMRLPSKSSTDGLTVPTHLSEAVRSAINKAVSTLNTETRKLHLAPKMPDHFEQEIKLLFAKINAMEANDLTEEDPDTLPTLQELFAQADAIG